MYRYNKCNLGIGAILSTLTYLTIIFKPSSAARILITTPQHGSHLLDKLALGETLVARGHEVYVVVADKHPKLTEIPKRGVKPLTYFMPSGLMVADSQEFHKMITDNVFNGASPIVTGQMVSELISRDCTYMMADDNFLKKVKDQKFDMVISETFILSPCYTILPIHLNIPYVSLNGMYLPMEIRVPALPSFYSMEAPYTLENIGKRTIVDKVKGLAFYVLFNNLDSFISGRSNRSLIHKYAPQYSSWGEIVRKAELYLTQVDHHLGGHFPAMPNFISVAGLTVVPAKPLPVDLEKIMQDSGEHGVILATFGASAYYTPANVVKIFFDAFSKINQTVLARFGIPDGVKVPKNVKLLKWLPQSDILGHPKTKLFITHCGSNGQYESLYHAVPMIGFPLFAEQHANSIRAKDKGIAIEMNVLEFTSDELVRNIHEVIYTDKYRNKIKQMSERWRDEKVGPRDRGAFWVEHVIKYGGRHLRSPAMELPVYELLMLDVIFVIIALFAVFAAVAVCVIRALCCICRFCRRAFLATGGKVKLS